MPRFLQGFWEKGRSIAMGEEAINLLSPVVELEAAQLLLPLDPFLVEVAIMTSYVITDDGEVVDPDSGQVLEVETRALTKARLEAKASKYYASALAERLVGGRVSLGTSDDCQTILLDARGEEILAAPGEGKIHRAAALLLLEAATPWVALGKEKDDDGNMVPNGRTFGIGGSGYAPGFKMSPGYQRKHSAASRKELRQKCKLLQRRLAAITYDRSKKAGGEIRPLALVLTTPTIDPSLLSGIMVTEESEERRLFMAWQLLRKRDLWKDNVFGGFRGYEITRKYFSDFGVMLFHPHFHLLIFARFIEQWMLAQEWWDCLRIATMAIYGGFDISSLYDPTKCFSKDSSSKWSQKSEDKFKHRTQLEWAITASVYIQAIRRKAKPGSVRDELGHREGPTTLESAIHETLKYCTKADKIAAYERDLERPGEMKATGLPTDYLQREIYRRSCQIFAKLGAARSTWTLPEWCEMADGVSKELVAELLGEAAKKAAQDICEARNADAVLAQEASEELRALQAANLAREVFSAHKMAAFAHLIESDSEAPNDARLLAGEARERAEVDLHRATTCLLDTPAISDGDPDGTTAKKRLTLRDLMDTMPLHEWLQIASRRAFNSLQYLQDGLRKKGYFVTEFIDITWASPG